MIKITMAEQIEMKAALKLHLRNLRRQKKTKPTSVTLQDRIETTKNLLTEL